MGNLCIPKKLDPSTDNDDTPVNIPRRKTFTREDPDEYDTLAVEVLKAEFKDDPETFILNQILMCYMFFEDFTEEIRVLHHTTSQKAQQLNSTLIQDHKKQFFMPDSILETVNEKVRFEHSSGPKKGAIEPLASQRLIIIHDNVEVIDNIEGYTTIDKPHYRATVDESKDSTGFVKVNIFETAEKFNNYKPSSGDSACSTSSQIYKGDNKRKSIIDAVFAPLEDLPDTTRNDSGVSTSVNSDPEYEYSRITAAQTPQSIDITEPDSHANIYQLPPSCIVKLKEKNIDLDSDDDEDDDEEDDDLSKKKRKMEKDLFIYKYYLDSSEFMKHFQNTVFPNYIGTLLGFTQKSIQVAKSIPGAMFCNRKDYNNSFWEISDFVDNMIEFEVVPAISMPWLHSTAFEWVLRRRPTVYDQKENKRISYKWPTEKMISEAKKLHSIIVPKGFMPKKQENSQMHLEWEVRFPKIEKYLEFRMSHAQTRVFLYMIVLFKKFMEPLTQKHGLSMEHLRFLIFWECEANYKDWLEDKLGQKMKAILNTLYGYLGKGHLPHYFIRSKNMLENVPRKYLISNQEVIHDILESPVSYFLTALKDLKYSSDKFYPQPNIEELENILKSENALKIGNPINDTTYQNQFTKKHQKDSKNKLDKEQLWFKKFVEMKRINTQNEQDNEEQSKKNLASERIQLSLDVNINFKKKFCNTQTARQILLLTYFIKQFIEIAQKSLEISSTGQTMFYLTQATYLTKLLEEIESEIEHAKRYQAQINLAKEYCMRKMVGVPQGPSMPKRNSATFAIHSDILQVKGRDINLLNLNMAYNSTVIAREAKPTTSAMKKKAEPKPDLLESAENVESNVSATESQKNDNDTNSIASDLENRIVENIEVIADVHNETETKNYGNDDNISLNDLENNSRINDISDDLEKEIKGDDDTFYKNEDEDTNSIMKEFENIIQVETQKSGNDTISLNNLFDEGETLGNQDNFMKFENTIEVENEKDDIDIISLNDSESTSTNSGEEDSNSTHNDLEKSTVENVETIADVNNETNDDRMLVSNRLQQNPEIVTSPDQNTDINGTTNDLEKSTVENGKVDTDVHDGSITENKSNDNDTNSLNNLKNNPEIENSINQNDDVTANHVNKSKVENDEEVSDISKTNLAKNKKNDDNLALSKKSKPMFRLVTFAERDKD